MPVKIDSDVRIAASRQNKTAGILVRRARTAADMPQGDFSKAVARRLGLAALSQSAMSDWERGVRQVPAAAILAAAEVARMDPAELFAAESKRVSETERLLRDIERVAGALTPRQAEKVRSSGITRK